MTCHLPTPNTPSIYSIGAKLERRHTEHIETDR